MLEKFGDIQGLPPIDLTQILHADSQSEILVALPVEGSLLVDAKVVDVIDKKKFGLIVVQTDLWDSKRATLHAKVFNTILVKKLGTFKENIANKFDSLVDTKC
mmetsp:Transcript_117397/g.252403  ORF Transcript_117397/g.252403 Transcript_117397/m.252403 type:complete len:103 (-) Transcript_117397:1205-1513(-)